VLRGHRFDIILNAQAPTGDKYDDLKDIVYEELEQVFDHFPEYHMKILLGDFNTKLRREDLFKPTIWDENLHENINATGIIVVNFATSKKSGC
jgi:hypothetical protein